MIKIEFLLFSTVHRLYIPENRKNVIACMSFTLVLFTYKLSFQAKRCTYEGCASGPAVLVGPDGKTKGRRKGVSNTG